MRAKTIQDRRIGVKPGVEVWLTYCEKCKKQILYPMGWHVAFPELKRCSKCFKKN